MALEVTYCGQRTYRSALYRAVVRLALSCLLSFFVASGVVFADEVRLLSISLRTQFSDATTIGDNQPEEFQAVDLAALYKLPPEHCGLWKGYFGTLLMASAGGIRGAGKTGLVVSLVPGFAYGSRDTNYLFDLGAGFALFGRDRFGKQDFGGPFQFVLTAGAGFPLYKQLGGGYRFLHYSDAGINGSDTTGADFHMIELRYRFR